MEFLYPAPLPTDPANPTADFSVGGGLAPQPGQYTTQSGGYDYEWMNAVNQAADLFQNLFPVVQEYGRAFGLMPSQSEPSGITVQPVPEPKPWYQDVPPWAWGAAAALGAVVLIKLLN